MTIWQKISQYIFDGNALETECHTHDRAEGRRCSRHFRYWSKMYKCRAFL